MIYSMTHPLDIAAPVAYSKGGSTGIIHSKSFKMVFASETLDLCLVYDDCTHQHIICRLRRLKTDELDAMNKTNVNSSQIHTKVSVKMYLEVFNCFKTLIKA